MGSLAHTAQPVDPTLQGAIDSPIVSQEDNCADYLPATTDTARHLFVQFVELKANNPTGPGTLPVVVPRSVAWPTILGLLTALNPSISAQQLQGGVALSPEWKSAGLPGRQFRTIEVSEPISVIASRQVTTDGGNSSVHLDPFSIGNLLRGQAAIARIDADGELVCLRPITPRGQVPSTFEVPDLVQFLAEPSIVLSNGAKVLAQLTPDNIEALQEKGRADVVAAGSTTTVVVNPAATAPPSETLLSSTLPPDLPVVVYIPWEQKWMRSGYWRGDLLNTLSLAPQEEATIEIFTWDRYRRSYEMTSSVEVQNSVDQSDTVRNTEDTTQELTKTSEFNRQADGHIGVTVGAVNVGVSGGVQLKDSVNSVAKRTTGRIAEGTKKAAHQLKQSRQTKVSESWESGKEQRVTRKVTNANMCHSLNLYYYEIVGSYDVTTSIDVDHVALCALVPFPDIIKSVKFDRDTIRKYVSPLRQALMFRDLADGFDASQLLAAHERACRYACESCFCSSTGPGSSDAWSWVDDVLGAVAASGWTITHASPKDLYDAILFNKVSPGLIRVFRRWAYWTALAIAAPALTTELIDVVVKSGQNHQKLEFDDADLFAYALNEVGGVPTLSPPTLLAEQYNNLGDSAKLACNQIYGDSSGGVFDYLIGPQLKYLHVWTEIDDAGLQARSARFSDLYKATVTSTSGATATRDQTATDAVAAIYSVGDLAGASERESALVGHLQTFPEHYRYAIWQSLSAEDQAALITTNLPPGLVEPRVVGLVGDQLAVPLLADQLPLACRLRPAWACATLASHLSTTHGRRRSGCVTLKRRKRN